jgi:hypothetical protein
VSNKETADEHDKIERELQRLEDRQDDSERRLRLLELEVGIYKLSGEGEQHSR